MILGSCCIIIFSREECCKIYNTFDGAYRDGDGNYATRPDFGKDCYVAVEWGRVNGIVEKAVEKFMENRGSQFDTKGRVILYKQ